MHNKNTVEQPIKNIQLRRGDKQNEICSEDYNDLFYTVFLSVHWLFLRLSLLPFLSVFVCPPVCLSSIKPPGTSKVHSNSTLPPTTQECGPSCWDLTRPTIKTQFYRGCYCTVKRECKLLITYLLLLDKGGHINRGSEAV